jgi:hypothetical protein
MVGGVSNFIHLSFQGEAEDNDHRLQCMRAETVASRTDRTVCQSRRVMKYKAHNSDALSVGLIPVPCLTEIDNLRHSSPGRDARSTVRNIADLPMVELDIPSLHRPPDNSLAARMAKQHIPHHFQSYGHEHLRTCGMPNCLVRCRLPFSKPSNTSASAWPSGSSNDCPYLRG